MRTMAVARDISSLLFGGRLEAMDFMRDRSASTLGFELLEPFMGPLIL
jgi:hypothetical protein